jgi:hypothetical protein
MFACWALVGLAACAGAVYAQDGGAVPPAAPTAADPAAKKALVDALRRTLGADGFALRGSVSERTPDSGGGGAVVVNGGGAAAEFRGEFEVASTKEGELAVKSKRALPGFALYRRDDRTLVQTIVEDEGLGTSSTAADLASLLDRDRLANAVERAEVSMDGPATARTYTLKLGKGFVRAGSAGPMAAFSPKILKVEAAVRVEAGAVASIRFVVLRSDPLAGVRSRAGGGGSVELTGPIEDDGRTEGATRTYDLTPAGPPSAGLREAIVALRKVFDDA